LGFLGETMSVDMVTVRNGEQRMQQLIVGLRVVG
jgi:hypothetical protein